MNRIYIAAWLLVGMTMPAMAGPDATANRFLSDTPSMMDFGAVRLESHLRAKEEFRDVSVRYDWDRNRVVVLRFLLLRNDDERNLEDDCRDWMQSLRAAAMVFDGRVFGGREYSNFAEFFGHVGFRRTIAGQPEDDALVSLDKIIVLETQYGRYDDSNWNADMEMTCTGEVVGTGFSVSRE